MTYTAGVLSETRHLYYSEPSKWQVIEERLGSSSDAERQFVWGLRYIDDLVLRDRDTDANGSLDERLYALQDANWNVTAVTNAGGTVQERYAYSAYGVPVFLDASFASRGSSSYAWETLYAGYRWDAAIKHFHVRHRVFNPTLGCWLERDLIGIRPFGWTPHSSLYMYCDGSPLTDVDPSGMLGVAAIMGLACLVGGSIAGIWQLISDFRNNRPPSVARIACAQAIGCLGGLCLSGTILATIELAAAETIAALLAAVGIDIAIAELCSWLYRWICNLCINQGCRPTVFC